MENPRPADYELLARTLCLGRETDPDTLTQCMDGTRPEWQMESIDEDNDCVSQTRDTLDDFRRHSQQWREPGHCQEINGGLYWERCQALRGQQRCELCVVDCGTFRLCYQV